MACASAARPTSNTEWQYWQESPRGHGWFCGWGARAAAGARSARRRRGGGRGGRGVCRETPRARPAGRRRRRRPARARSHRPPAPRGSRPHLLYVGARHREVRKHAGVAPPRLLSGVHVGARRPVVGRALGAGQDLEGVHPELVRGKELLARLAVGRGASGAGRSGRRRRRGARRRRRRGRRARAGRGRRLRGAAAAARRRASAAGASARVGAQPGRRPATRSRGRAGRGPGRAGRRPCGIGEPAPGRAGRPRARGGPASRWGPRRTRPAHRSTEPDRVTRDHGTAPVAVRQRPPRSAGARGRGPPRPGPPSAIASPLRRVRPHPPRLFGAPLRLARARGAGVPPLTGVGAAGSRARLAPPRFRVDATYWGCRDASGRNAGDQGAGASRGRNVAGLKIVAPARSCGR
jgi:hypothetical protein